MPRSVPGRLRPVLLSSPFLAICATIVLSATTFAATGGADWPLR